MYSEVIMSDTSCKNCKQCGGSLPRQYYRGQHHNYRKSDNIFTAYGRMMGVSHGVGTPGTYGKFTGPNLSHYGPGVNPGFKGGARKTEKRDKKNKKNKKKTKKNHSLNLKK